MVSDTVLVAIIGAVPSTLAALLGLASWIQSRSNGGKLDQVQDGMKSKLEQETTEKKDAQIAQATAEGKETGRLQGESEAAARK